MQIIWSLPGHSGGGKIDQDVLETPLPADRDYEEAGLCYGHYVRAVESVLDSEGGRVVSGLLHTHFPENPPEVLSIHVAILKHGHFYHPACMTLHTAEGAYPFVINLAVTPEAGGCARREYALLGKLAHRSEALPRVQSLESVMVDGHTVVLFFGEWFEGFHEFHETRGPEGDQVVVWAGEDHRLVSKEVETSIYRQTAEILTLLYNPLTFELVQPWHHAAGDFVVNIESAKARVKLITVRQYTPMVNLEEVEAEDLLEGALLFLMTLSIRNRLDRYDGIGEVAWVGDHGVSATVEGFFDGLMGRDDIGGLDGPFGGWVAKYLAAHTLDEFQETALAVVSSFNPRASEMGVLKEHLADHVAVFYGVIKGRDEN
ncbi:hypothetical protein DSLASN_37960 [Desulfoluna limicola]|uniref:Uncharacterized protein n=1 Tax=Desulfoluna limicola TaxID=2810562 RepID=A0ABN6F758_9BACT|nr:hypothetical protein [Desulfoluna limicola]BCS98164.1 hypothetical protein DSLASN_37960 [Desulfoluna limicola]